MIRLDDNATFHAGIDFQADTELAPHVTQLSIIGGEGSVLDFHRQAGLRVTDRELELQLESVVLQNGWVRSADGFRGEPAVASALLVSGGVRVRMHRVRVSGFTNEADDSAAVLVRNGGRLVAVECVFDENLGVSEDAFGALALDSSAVELTASEFRANFAFSGAGWCLLLVLLC